ncbi:MAG: hypothetical protein QUT30_16555 [Acidobacteriota bacterium]|jgi:hypothetical protein|nr:hypothetical protein [Acidobacteriota bacterium]
MLLPSILQILSGDHVQSKVVKSVESGFKAEMTAAVEGMSGSEGSDVENGGKAGFLKPVELAPSFPERPPAGQSLEELLRTIHKFQKPNPKRVVDVFE